MTTEYVCVRWRDAVTDPPDNGWFGMVNRENYTRTSRIQNGWLIPISPNDAAIKAKPGDQWLDITDIPAIPRKKVQAAVNDIKGVYDVPCDNESAENYNKGMDAALRLIAAHTGITPSITEDSSVTGIEHEHDDHFPDVGKKVTP